MFPLHNIEEEVVRLLLVVSLFVISGSTAAQVPQNPEACALLRADLDEAHNRFITSGLPPDVAMALVERMLEMRRKTGTRVTGRLLRRLRERVDDGSNYIFFVCPLRLMR